MSPTTAPPCPPAPIVPLIIFPPASILFLLLDRPQGGGGWLRYMTVQPSRDRVAVRTYNPSTGAARLSTGCTSLDLDGPPCKHHDFSFKLCMTEGCTDQQ